MWNPCQPTNKEGIHLQNKNVREGKDLLSTVSVVIILKREEFHTVAQDEDQETVCRLQKANLLVL